MTSVTRERVNEALTRGTAVAGTYRALLVELDRCNHDLTKVAINSLVESKSGLNAARLSEAHPRNDITDPDKAVRTLRGVKVLCDNIDRWTLEHVQQLPDEPTVSEAAKTLFAEMRELARKWNTEFSSIAESHVRELFNGVIAGYAAPAAADRQVVPVASGAPSPPPAVPDSQVYDMALDGPRIPRLAQLRFELVDQGGNRGSFETPEVHIELIFGSGEDSPSDSEPAMLGLSNCRIRLGYPDGEVEETLPGSSLKFQLRYQVQDDDRHKIESMELVMEPMVGGKGAEWYSQKGQKHRRLFGKSLPEYLCTFRKRPSQLQIYLEAAHCDFKLVEHGKMPVHRADPVDRVKAALARIATLGRPDSGGFVILDQRRII